MKVKYEAMSRAECIRVRGLLCILQIPWSCTDSAFTEVDDNRNEKILELTEKLRIAEAFIEEMVELGGRYPELHCIQLVADSYAVLAKLRGENKKGGSV